MSTVTFVQIICNSLSDGGAEKQILLLACGLAKKGLKVEVSTLQSRPISPRYECLMANAIDAGAIFHLGLGRTLRALLVSPLCRQNGIVWTWGMKANLLGWACYPLLRMTPIACVGSIRSASPERIKRFRWLYRSGSLFSRGFIANSQRAVDLLKQHAGPGIRAVVLPNIIEPSWLNDSARRRRTEPGNRLRVAMLGNVRLMTKGYDLVIRAARKLKDDGLPIEFHIAGGGPEAAELQQMIKDTGVSDVVFFNGKTESPMEYLADKDCFLLASRFEGSSNSLLEAMALGLPCFSSDVGDVQSINAEGEIVKLFPVGNPTALGRVLTEALNDWDATANRGKTGRNYVHLRHQEEKVIDQCLVILNGNFRT